MPTSCLPQLLPHRSRAVEWGEQPCWPLPFWAGTSCILPVHPPWHRHWVQPGRAWLPLAAARWEPSSVPSSL